MSTCLLPAGSGWSSRAPACWAQAETEPQRWPPLGRHSCWHTACRSSSGWEAPRAPDTTASSERLNETHMSSVFIFKPDIYVYAQWFFTHYTSCPSSPGTLGSERFSGILHWSTWSFNAFTSSMSPGTLRNKITTRQLHSAARRGTSTSIVTDCPVAKTLLMCTQLASNVAWWLKVLFSLFAVLLWNQTKTE